MLSRIKGDRNAMREREREFLNSHTKILTHELAICDNTIYIYIYILRDLGFALRVTEYVGGWVHTSCRDLSFLCRYRFL